MKLRNKMYRKKIGREQLELGSKKGRENESIEGKMNLWKVRDGNKKRIAMRAETRELLKREQRYTEVCKVRNERRK